MAVETKEQNKSLAMIIVPFGVFAGLMLVFGRREIPAPPPGEWLLLDDVLAFIPARDEAPAPPAPEEWVLLDDGLAIVSLKEEAPPSAGDFVYTEQVCGIRAFIGAPAWNQPTWQVKITNQGAVAGTRIITFYYRSIWQDTGDSAGELQKRWEQTLEPGFSVVVSGDTLWPPGEPPWVGEPGSGIPAAMGYPVRAWMHVEDDAGGSTPECTVLSA